MDNFNLAWVDTRFAIVPQSFNEFNFFAETLRIFHVGEYSINYADTCFACCMKDCLTSEQQFNSWFAFTSAKVSTIVFSAKSDSNYARAMADFTNIVQATNGFDSYDNVDGTFFPTVSFFYFFNFLRYDFNFGNVLSFR